MARKRIVAGLAGAAILAVIGVSQAQAPASTAAGIGVLPVAAALVALAALATAAVALMQARRTHAELTRFTRSIEMALRTLSSRSERDAATLGELNRKIGDEIRELTEAAARGAQQRADMPAAAEQPPQPIALPATEAAQPAPPRPQAERGGEPEQAAGQAAQQALARIVASGEAEISLQPIISVARSAAAAFDVHLHVEGGEGFKPVDIRRLAGQVPGVDQTGFEVALVRAAIAAGRRQLGSAAERMPFHVAISEGLLAAPEQVRSIAELAQLHKPLPASIVFSIPAALLAAGGESRRSLDLLTAAGFRLAAESWDGDAADAAAAANRGVAFVRVSANRLLDRERARRRGPTGAELAAAAGEAGLTVVATQVSRDEDAVGLIDLGIDLMVGERFSGPRRIRSATARQTAMAEA